ncbi:MAG: hypothetical protein ABID61_01850 [Candidatus Micrarchaeota archaeon]
MRGQISFEYLFLSLVSLSLISISVVALITIKDMSIMTVDLLHFASSARSLGNTINEVCALGDGNSRSIDIGRAITVESTLADVWIVRFSQNDFSLVRPTLCKVEALHNIEKQVYVKNENGVVKLQ